LKKENDEDGPVKTLRAFKRVHIPAGETTNVTFELTGKQFEWWNANTQSVDVNAGDFDILVGGNSTDKDLSTVRVKLRDM
jgi:beta-glucosidase